MVPAWLKFDCTHCTMKVIRLEHRLYKATKTYVCEGLRGEDEDQDHVCSNPSQDRVRSGISIVICLLCQSVSVLLLLRRFAPQSCTACRPHGVNIFTGGWKLDFKHVRTILASDLLGTTEILGRSV